MKTSPIIDPTHPFLVESIERPRKKLRASSNVDNVAILTDIGLSNFRTSKFMEAEKCFSQALCRVDIRFLCASIQSSLYSIAQKSEPAHSISHNDDVAVHLEYVDMTSKEVDKILYTYQGHEYDEGMRAYLDPISTEGVVRMEHVSSIIMYNLAQTYVQRGRYDEAETWLDRVMAPENEVEAKFPRLHVKVLHTKGYCAYRLGRNADSIQQYEKALPIAVSFNSMQLGLAATLNSLGVLNFHRNADDADRAMSMFEQSLAIYTNEIGNRSLEAATVQNNIGRVYYLWSKYDKALDIYKEALETRRLILGTSSFDVAATVYNTGQTHQQLGNSDEAMSCYDLFLKITKSRIDSENRDTAVVYKCMADIFREKGDLRLALKFYTKALDAGRSSLGRFHPDVASTLNKLGNLCYEMKNHVAALKHYKEGLAVEVKVLAPNHPHIQITLTNMAHIYKYRGDYSAALRTYHEVHLMQKKSFGINAIEVAGTLCSMGLMQYHLKCYDAAFDSYQEALRIRRDHHGSDDHTDIASTLNSIGLVLFKQDMFELAKNCFEEGLRIRRTLLGPEHRDVAILWYNIATIYFESGDDEVAIRCYKEALRVERAALGNDHSDVVLTLQHLGQVLQQLGDLPGALGHFLEALKTEQKRKVARPIAIAKIMNLIGNIHLQQGEIGKMMECYTGASRIYQARQERGETLVIAGYNFYGLSKMHPSCAPVA